MRFSHVLTTTMLILLSCTSVADGEFLSSGMHEKLRHNSNNYYYVSSIKTLGNSAGITVPSASPSAIVPLFPSATPSSILTSVHSLAPSSDPPKRGRKSRKFLSCFIVSVWAIVLMFACCSLRVEISSFLSLCFTILRQEGVKGLCCKSRQPRSELNDIIFDAEDVNQRSLSEALLSSA